MKALVYEIYLLCWLNFRPLSVSPPLNQRGFTNSSFTYQTYLQYKITLWVSLAVFATHSSFLKLAWGAVFEKTEEKLDVFELDEEDTEGRVVVSGGEIFASSLFCLVPIRTLIVFLTWVFSERFVEKGHSK